MFFSTKFCNFTKTIQLLAEAYVYGIYKQMIGLKTHKKLQPYFLLILSEGYGSNLLTKVILHFLEVWDETFTPQYTFILLLNMIDIYYQKQNYLIIWSTHIVVIRNSNWNLFLNQITPSKHLLNTYLKLTFSDTTNN